MHLFFSELLDAIVPDELKQANPLSILVKHQIISFLPFYYLCKIYANEQKRSVEAVFLMLLFP